jgi:rhodanese-related sulfurtransferase
MNHITPIETTAKLKGQTGDIIFLDVRTSGEFEHRRIGEAINIPVDELYLRYRELDPKKEIIVICEHGIRSQNAAGLLMQLGFDNVWNMVGGMSQFSAETISGKKS